MITKTTINYEPGIELSLEPFVRQAITEAVARQKALGLPNFHIRNGKIYGRSPNGRFVSTKSFLK